MNENTINERKKTDIGKGIQMSKYLHHNSPALQGNKVLCDGGTSHGGNVDWHWECNIHSRKSVNFILR